jgi:hypothetical protein
MPLPSTTPPPSAGGMAPSMAMQRISTTVVALVGADATDRTRDAGGLGNVLAVVPEDGDALDRAVAAWSGATSSSRTYVVHDADPLAAVARQWVALYDGTGQRGALEAAVAAVTARWRARSVELPDYYLVLDAEDMPATLRHWFLGVLRDAAPSRVVPVQATTAAVDRALRRLPAGRWWPDLPDLLAGIDRVAPDAVDTTSTPDPTLLRSEVGVASRVSPSS